MKKDMLGPVVRRLADLPKEMMGTIYDLIEKLAGGAGQDWLAELKKFLRRERCWAGIMVGHLLRLISGGEYLVVDSVDGSELLADIRCVDVDSNFRKLGLDQPGRSTPATRVHVYEMATYNASFSSMFGSLNSNMEKLCLTQHQIKNFRAKYPGWFEEYGSAVFFLLKSYGQFFVIELDSRWDGKLVNNVYRLENSGYSWDSARRHRLVVPQLGCSLDF